MVFICMYNDELIDAYYIIHSSKNMIYICCDNECSKKITFKRKTTYQ